MLYSRRGHVPELRGAEVLLDRAIGRSVVFRRVMIRGLVHDERLLAAPMRSDRCRLTAPLEGEVSVSVNGQLRPLPAGAFLATARVGSAPTRAASSLTLEIDWDPGGIGGALGSDVVLGTLSQTTRARLEDLAQALETRPLGDPTVRAALAALAKEGLPFEPDAVGDELEPASPDDQRVLDALDAVLCRLEHSPDTEDFVAQLGCTRRTLTRRLRRLATLHRMYDHTEDWRSERDFYRGLVATLFLSHPDATTATVSRMLGYRSAAALCHAFRRAGLPSPGRVRRALGG